MVVATTAVTRKLAGILCTGAKRTGQRTVQWSTEVTEPAARDRRQLSKDVDTPWVAEWVAVRSRKHTPTDGQRRAVHGGKDVTGNSKQLAHAALDRMRVAHGA